MASAIGGVPASNFDGSSAGVKPSRRTSAIMSPPPRKGGMASSSSSRPHRTPMPDGPAHLVGREGEEVGAHGLHVGGHVGHELAGVDDGDGAVVVGLVAERTRTGLMVPRTFDIAVKQNALAPSSSRSRSVRSSRPSGVSGSQRISKPFSAASICQGTMLAWCSIWVSSTASPSPRLAPPHDRATRFIASVAFLVKTSSRSAGALTKRFTLQPGRLEGLGGLGGQLVDAAVDVGVRRLVEALHGLEHLAGLLADGGRVEVHDALAVDLPVEDREVLADATDVELGPGLGHQATFHAS